MTTSILSPQLNTQAALAESDAEAFTRLLRPMLKRGVENRGFTHDTPQVVDGDLSSIRIRVDREHAPVGHWVYDGQLELRYRRVPLTALLARYGGVVRADLPTTIRDLMSSYFLAQNLHDRSSQIQDGPVTSLGMLRIDALPGQFLLHGSADYEVRPFQRHLRDVLTTLTVPGYRTVEDFDYQAVVLLVNQLNQLNATDLPYALEMELISLGSPANLTGYQYDNTRIAVTAFGDGYYLGSVDIVYSRYDFGWYTMGQQLLIDGPPQPDLDYILDQVSTQTNLPLSRADIEIPALPTTIPAGRVETLTIFFKASNLRYVGELTIDYRAV